MNRFIFLILLLAFNINLLKAQEGVLVPKSQIIGEWRNPQLIKTDDGFLLASNFYYVDGFSLLFTKLDEAGNEMWEKYTLTGATSEDFRILKAADAFYIVGITSSDANDTFSEGPKGKEDIYVLKFNLEAELQWDKRLGGNGYNILSDAKITPNGNIMIAGGHSFYHQGMNYPRSNFYMAILSPEKDILVEEIVSDFTDNEPNDDQWIKSIDMNAAGEVYAFGWTDYVTSRDASSVSKSGKSVLLKFSNSGDLLESEDIAEDYDFDNQQKALLSIDNSDNIIVVYPDIEQASSGTKKKSVLKFAEDLSMEWSKTLETNGEDDFHFIEILEDNSILLSGESNSNFGGDINDIKVGGTSYQSIIMKVSSSGAVEWTKFYDTQNENTGIKNLILGSDNKVYGALSNPLTSLSDSSVSLYRTGAVVTFEFETDNSNITINENIAQTGLSACGAYLRWDKAIGNNSNMKYLLKLNDEIAYAGADTVTLVDLIENTNYEMELFALDAHLNQTNIVNQSFTSPKNVQANIAGNFIFNSSSSNEIYDLEGNSDGSKIVVGKKFGDYENELIEDSYGSSDGIILKLSADNIIINALSIGGSESDIISDVVKHEDGYFCALLHNSADLKFNGESKTVQKGISILKLDKDLNIVWDKLLAGDTFENYIDESMLKDLQITENSVVAIVEENEETALYNIDIETSDFTREVVFNNESYGSLDFLNYLEQGDTSILVYTAFHDVVIEKRSNGLKDSIVSKDIINFGSFYNPKVQILENGNYILGFSNEYSILNVTNEGSYDTYFVELDGQSGDIVHSLSVAGTNSDLLQDFIITSSGKIKASIASLSTRIGATNFLNRGYWDELIVDIDWTTKGFVNSQQYGGDKNDFIRVIKESEPGTFHFGGYSASTSCDLISHNISNKNMWLIDYRDEKDETPPTAPTNLDTLQHENDYETVLGWDAATDNYGIAFYNVYKDDQLIGQSFNTNLYELKNSDFERKSYQFKVTAVDYARLEGEPANLDLDFEIILSVDDFMDTRADINVYPIPVQDKLNVQVPDELGSDLQFIIYDQYGHQVKAFEKLAIDGNNIELNQLGSLNSGVYILRIISSTGSISKRIIKF